MVIGTDFLTRELQLKFKEKQLKFVAQKGFSVVTDFTSSNDMKSREFRV